MDAIIDWLIEGDVSVQYLTHVHLLKSGQDVLLPLQERIEHEGYGKEILSCRNPNGHWGLWFYQMKWTSTHYTLLDLMQLGLKNDVQACREMVLRALDTCMLENGGLNLAKSKLPSDIAVDGMFLQYASYFCPGNPHLEHLVQFILSQAKPDGGYSWEVTSKTSDPHTTLCVLEGFHFYKTAGFTQHLQRIQASEKQAVEYLLDHDLFMHDNPRYLKLTYPYRYHYSVLRMLEYWYLAKTPYDPRMEKAYAYLEHKKQDQGYFLLEYSHPGKTHIPGETIHHPSRFITLKALSILQEHGT